LVDSRYRMQIILKRKSYCENKRNLLKKIKWFLSISSSWNGKKKEWVWYHRYDSRTQIGEDDGCYEQLFSFDGETCNIIETEEGEDVRTLTTIQLQNMDQYDRNRSTNDGSVRSERRGSNLSSSEIDSLPLPYSPATELRQLIKNDDSHLAPGNCVR